MKKEKKSTKSLKTELAIIYLTTDDKKFLNIKDAVEHQGILEKYKEKKSEEMKMIVDVKQLVEEILRKNDWGIYFKTEPITSLPVKDKNKIYKVNDVTMDRLMDAIDMAIGTNEGNEWKDRKQNTS
jgi:hypothetical protein